MSSYGSTTNFSLEYVVSVIVVLIVCNLLLKSSPKMNVIVVIMAGLFVGYISLLIMNSLFPKINQFSQNIYQYYLFQYMSNFNNMGYFHVWPPILAILIIFIVLLYNNQLG